ncbi:c-type cytochrome [Roseiconus nitratireducens]|uniref:C-type cytochrome n=1 Tax=Roseiconus nitratireducens TaxID=2605748 RepID=A0A5M6D0U1_9BACT|nr:c-type cytochrome [Roseiconus nitratireducens]KAA5539902.1 c-type cytochrome [Roseiconus nitratireducens]
MQPPSPRLLPHLIGTLCFAATVGINASCFAVDSSESIELVLQAVQNADQDSTREALLRGMLRGLEGRRRIAEPATWRSLSQELSTSENSAVRDAAAQLSQIFGNEKALQNALVTVRNEGAFPADRQSALASLVSQRYPELSKYLEPLLDVPELRVDAIRALAVIPRQDAPSILLERYRDFPSEAQRATVETLATRERYAQALVAALKRGTVKREEIPSYVARSLDELMGESFRNVYGTIPALQQDTAERIAKFKSIITPDLLAKADPSNGRAVFNKTCGACHQMYGSGGNIGPDLTGSNRANLDYLLLNSVAPSADVPASYRTVVIQTVDGRILTGVLAEEDRQRVVLKMVDQPRVVIAQDDIEARKVSEKSMMPEGQLEQLQKRDLIDLVKYMQTKQQVEAAQ